MTSKEKYGKGYGKRPIWQWILIYAIVGLVIYALIYFFIIAKRNGTTTTNYNYSPSKTAPTTIPQTTSVPNTNTNPVYRVPGY